MLMAINRLLDICKTNSGVALTARPETICLQDTLSWAIECLRRNSNEASRIVSVIDTAVSNFLITDKHWLRENLICLLSNAIKYSQESSTITIRSSVVCSETARNMLLVEVEDSGIGVSANVNTTERACPLHLGG